MSLTRPEAKEKELAIYYNGPCKKGHEGGRYTSNGSCVDCVKQFAQDNPGVNQKAVTNYQKRNPDKIRKGLARWRAGNPEAARLQRQHRRKAEGYYTKTDIDLMLKEQEGCCNYCRIEFKANWEIDHVKPVSKGGTNWPTNLQLLCRSCNAKKAAIYPYVYVKENND